MLKRSLQGATALLVGATVLLALNGVGSPVDAAAACQGTQTIQDGRLVRLSGTDRIQTAVAISQDSYAGGTANAAVLARADDFADGLTGAPLARRINGPLLLTSRSSLSSAVLSELARAVRPGATVYLLGGTAALADVVSDAVADAGFAAVRLSGTTRYDTAARIAEEFGAVATIGIANGENFADALSLASPAARDGFPILLTRSTALPTATRDFLADHAAAAGHIAGLTAAVSSAVEESVRSTLTGSLTRHGGATRYETSAVIAGNFFGTSPCNVALASGAVFADGISGGAHAGLHDAPLLLTTPNELAPSSKAYLEAGAGPISGAYLYGGIAAISEQTATIANATFEPDTFVFFGDSGESNEHWNSIAAQVVSRVQSEDVDGIFMLGDNIYFAGATSATDPRFATLYEGPLWTILDRIKLYVVLGNHDVVTANGQYEVDYGATHPWWVLPAHYYTRELEQTCLVALDTNQAAVDQNQLDFLSSACASSSALHRIVIGHHPVHSSGEHGLNDDQPWMNTLVRPVLEATGTDFYLTGHDHNFEAIVPGADGVRYIVSGGASMLRPITATAISLFATSQYHFSKLELYASYADLTIYDENGGTIWTYRYSL